MAIKINADTTNGLVITPDTSGEIEFQQNGTKMIKFGPDGLELPQWTTAGRPSTPTAGIMGYNTTTGQTEYYDSTSSSWFTFSNNPSHWNIEYLVVGGGGGGGGDHGGGGGGGRVLFGTTFGGTGALFTATIGAGGTAGGPRNGVYAGKGGTTTLISPNVNISCEGGGGGGQFNNIPGYAGASGGGGASFGSGAGGGSATTRTVTGYNGSGGNNSGAGGGGGFSSDGEQSEGGYGFTSNITGTSLGYGGGGGGADRADGIGRDGGGNGNQAGNTAGRANSGGGGGGNTSVQTGNIGGSGVVILKLLTQHYTGTVTGSPSVTTHGPYTVIQFNSSGSYKA